MMTRIRRSALMIVTVFAVLHTAHAQEETQWRTILNLLPADTSAALIVPNMKTLSDQVVELLEGMDRANLLMGSRPLDQFKAAMGFNVGINDAGSVALVIRGDVSEGDPPVVLVPVSDADAFFAGNFTAHDGDAHTLPNGTVMHAKRFPQHVAIGPDAATIASFEPDPHIAQALLASIGERGSQLITTTDLFAFGKPANLRSAMGRMTEEAQERGMPVPQDVFIAPAMEHAESAMLAMDFDPLGLVVRSLVRFTPDSPPATIAAGQARGEALTRLPNKSYYFAISLDAASFAGPAGMNAMLQAMGVPHAPAWANDVQSIQMAVYPSPAGLAGGFFNDATLVIQTSNPAAVKQAIRDHIMALQKQNQGILWRVKWEENRKVNDAVGMADAYEITPSDVPAENFFFPMIWQNLFGSSGSRGFVRATDDSVIMTFSQRRPVLEAALQAQGETSLGSQPVFRTMRRMMPENAALQVYLSISPLAELARQIAGTFGAQDSVPQVDASLPPIGFAASPLDRGIETTTVIPSGILAMAFDQIMQQRMHMGDDDEDEEVGGIITAPKEE